MTYKIQTDTIRNTDYVTEGIQIMNSNTQTLKENIERLVNGMEFNIDDKEKGSKATVVLSKATIGNIEIDGTGSIKIYSNGSDGGAVGYIAFDDEDGKSVAHFDKVQCEVLENGSSVAIKDINETVFDDEEEPIEFNGDKSDYIVNVNLLTSPETTSPAYDGKADIKLSFEKCKNFQVVNVIFGKLNENTINSIELIGDYEFANGYSDDDEEKKTLDLTPYTGKLDKDYEIQISFMVQEVVGGKSKIIVLK